MRTMEKIYTENAPAAIGPYSQAMKVGNLVYTSGQIPIDPATGNIESQDIIGMMPSSSILKSWPLYWYVQTSSEEGLG